jgi:hypothetical protein
MHLLSEAEQETTQKPTSNPNPAERRNSLFAYLGHAIRLSHEKMSAEKPFAFLFLNTKPQSAEDVRIKLLTLPEVLSADTVLGTFDVICSIKAEDHEDLETSVLLIQQINGLVSSVTSIVSPLKVLPDW